ncbi:MULTISPECIES: MATE family efflux transporter [Clostridium]|uniref:Multidrug export protein MepA n=2 Tax=Clostridium TaxID=1485 RepID=D8GTD8_CLOLD|nr:MULTISPECIES: MATE family efflux transporter [Clostridium]ADK14587.1 putative Na+-driven multidrug efflux pump [Clostridium ljungdahlii DSM 13528]AGY77828.1 MATE family efflux transporter [Clostridium autoethanogenum DSM 10061]ALU37962.1 MATE efflux family protein [Clostridium autoethanogenum DSM 10061]OAA85824.1 Multidrug export protein MepA [Clostridium ljungdahlii DSM 13528]OVY50726.1 Multidrug export protein MepA [Clostridium autoethanogenum]
MEIENNTLKQGKIRKLLLKFAIPSVFALLVSELYNIVDTVYVGHYIGVTTLAAITIAFPIQKLLVALGLLIAVGASTYAARSLGEKNYSEFKKIVFTSFSLVLISLTIVSLIIFIFRRPIFYVLGADNLTYPLVNKYVSILLLGGIFQSLSVVACYIMISLKKTKALLYTNLIGVTLNILINYILIVKLHFKIEGAAIATVLSQITAFTFAFYKFKNIIREFHMEFSMHSIHNSVTKEIIWGIITVGFSTFIIEIEDALVTVVLNNLLYTEGGESAIVMVGVITKISMFLFVTIIGISSAMQPIVAYNFGAENYDKVKKVLNTSIKVVLITSFALWSIFMLFPNYIIGFFLNDTTLLNKTVKAFRLCICLIPLTGIYYVVINYYQAIGEAKKSFLLSIYREIIVFIPLAILLVQLFGIKGAWAAYPITDASAVLTSFYFLNKALKEDFNQVGVSEKF